MAEVTAMLRGGSRDGETARVDETVTRLRAASVAPGLLDVYEATEERTQLDQRQGEALVYEFVGTEAAGDMAPELIHMPATGGRTHPFEAGTSPDR
jgi:hypothetical protein